MSDWTPSINPGDPPTEAQLNYLDKLLIALEQEVERGRLAPSLYSTSEQRYLNCSTKVDASNLINDLKVLLNYE